MKKMIAAAIVLSLGGCADMPMPSPAKTSKVVNQASTKVGKKDAFKQRWLSIFFKNRAVQK